MEGYIIQACPQQAHLQRQLATAEQHVAAELEAANASSASPRKRQRTTHPSCMRLQASSPTRKGYEVDSSSSPASQPAAAAASFSHPEADTVYLDQLGLMAEILGAGQHGYTLKVRATAPQTTAPATEAFCRPYTLLVLKHKLGGASFLPALNMRHV